MTLKYGTIAITLKNRTERNAGRLVRVLICLGKGKIGCDEFDEAYDIEPLTGVPFAEVLCASPDGGFVLRPSLHCICDRKYLRPLVYPGGNAVEEGGELKLPFLVSA